MDVDYSNESSSDSLETNELSCTEEVNVAFEPIETDSSGEDSGSEEMVSESSSNSGNTRLQDTNW